MSNDGEFVEQTLLEGVHRLHPFKESEPPSNPGQLIPSWSSGKADFSRCATPSCTPESPTGGAMQLGMIGLGRMGANMVERLLRAGHECIVFDIHPEAIEAVARHGAVGA